MTSSTADPERQAATSRRGSACTFAHRPGICPQRPFTATPRNGGQPALAALVKAVEAAQAGTASATTRECKP